MDRYGTHGNVHVGNAVLDGAGDRGWLLGHFKPVGDVRRTEDLEIKWSVHPLGDHRATWVTGERRTALLVLISGRFRVELPGHSVLLAEQGDYVVWGPGVDHSWRAEWESVVMTVRWPSVPGYAVEGDPTDPADTADGDTAARDAADGAGTRGHSPTTGRPSPSTG